MTSTLIVTIISIAVLDSLNPSLFIGQFLLLTTPQPTPRTISYILGVVLVNFLSGVVILSGLRTVFDLWLDNLHADVIYTVQFVIGAAAVLFGLWLRLSENSTETARPLASLHPLYTFGFGMVVMINEMTTALPYFVALEQLANADVSRAESLVLLILYNGVFSLPLFGFLLLFLRLQGQFATQVIRWRTWINYWTPRVIKVASLAFGAALILNATSYAMSGTALF